jgi:hypothetical protein
MRQAIRALGWATNVFWIILLFFAATSVYSVLQIRPGFGKPYANASDGILTASLPFYIDNGGFYDIVDLNVTTMVKDNFGISITNSSTFLPVVQHGRNVSATHNMLIDINRIAVDSLSYLLFNDSNLNVDASLALDYASVVPLRISANFTMPWGAPLSNLAIGNLSVTSNMTQVSAVVPVSFENHSPFDLTGAIRLELVDNAGQVTGSGTASMVVPSEGSYASGIEVLLPSYPTNIRMAYLYFQTSIFNYGPVVIPIG